MKKIIYSIALLGSVLCTSLAQGQVVLEALEGNSFVPSARCLELVKDRNYGNGTHNFIYCAVMGPNGKKWLRHNLGAEYTKESSPHFNPEALPLNVNDWKASGSSFQYGRRADGHELISQYNISSTYWSMTRTNPLQPNYTHSTNSSNSFVNNFFRWAIGSPTLTELSGLWEGVNNPCPEGYHVARHSDVLLLLDNDDPKSWIFTNTGGTMLGVRNQMYPELLLWLGIGSEAEKTWTVSHPVTDRLTRISPHSNMWVVGDLGSRSVRFNAGGGRQYFSASPGEAVAYSLWYFQDFVQLDRSRGNFAHGYAVRCVEN